MRQSVDCLDRGVVTRACVDDVGAVIRALKTLKRYGVVFSWAGSAANRWSSDTKMVLVPLGEPFSPELVLRVEDWLTKNVPCFANAKIAPSGKYLGFFLGPTGGTETWKAPTLKYSLRLEETASLGAGVSLSTMLYNAKAVSVLSYVSQLMLPPPSFLRLEIWKLHRLFHLPLTLPLHAFFTWSGLGGPDPHSILAHSLAAMFRTSQRIVTSDVFDHSEGDLQRVCPNTSGDELLLPFLLGFFTDL